MALTIKQTKLWRKETDNTTGAGAASLAPLAEAGASLTVAMGYRIPGNEARAILEIAPVTGKKVVAAAQAAGFAASSLPALLVEGDDRAGLGRAITGALSEAGINLAFLVAQVLGRRYSAVIGFENEADLKKAGPVIRKASARPKPKSKKR